MSAAISTSRGPWREAWARLCRNRAAMISLVVLVLVAVACVGGAFAFHESQKTQNADLVTQPPGAAHWFGTDQLGRDVFQRVLAGGAISLLVGLVATVVAMVIGTGYGLISGLAGGRTDNFMMRVVDILYGFPFMAFIILMNVTFSDHRHIKRLGEMLNMDASVIFLFVAIGAVEWLTTARVVRAQALALKNQEFVLAARTYGAGTGRILWRHLFPNVIGQVIIYASLTVPAIMLLEAALSFLGLGVKPPYSSWGTLIFEGANNMETSPWLLAFPAAFFIITLLALNTLGDALRDALDPKSERGM